MIWGIGEIGLLWIALLFIFVMHRVIVTRDREIGDE